MLANESVRPQLSVKMSPYIVLLLLWIGWCLLHSLLAARDITDRLKMRLGQWAPFHRIIYNAVAIVTLIPVVAYTLSIEGILIFGWQGAGRIFQGVLLAVSLFFLIGGAKVYDTSQFIGIRQIREEKTCNSISEDCRLNTSGILSVVRHPWYTAGMVLVWARDLDVAAILVNLVICVYFIIGAKLEERRLVAEFGAEYEAYQERVSMLVPIKWMWQHWAKGN